MSDKAYDRVMAEAVPACEACGAALELQRGWNQAEVCNESLLVLGGGYGSFTDDLVNDGGYHFVICEACSMLLCRTLGLYAPIREHHTSTICQCPDRPARDEGGFPLPCSCSDCAAALANAVPSDHDKETSFDDADSAELQAQ
jgi:hypothetical protein